MNPDQRLILTSFDAPGTKAISLASLAVILSTTNVPVENTIAQMCTVGWLRRTSRGNEYERTEDGRLQLAGPLDVTIYSRPGCHLCGEAKSQMAPLLKEFGGRLTEIDIDQDPELRAKYDYDVPVIFLGARKVAKHRLDWEQFRRQLRESASIG